MFEPEPYEPSKDPENGSMDAEALSAELVKVSLAKESIFMEFLFVPEPFSDSVPSS